MINFIQVWCRRVCNLCLRYHNRAFYWIVLAILTSYIISNWETCISMQFFQHFDGNNILFLCWLLMIFLRMYRIKIRDIEIFTNLQNNLSNAALQHGIDERQQRISQQEQASTSCNQKGTSNNAQSAN